MRAVTSDDLPVRRPKNCPPTSVLLVHSWALSRGRHIEGRRHGVSCGVLKEGSQPDARCHGHRGQTSEITRPRGTPAVQYPRGEDDAAPRLFNGCRRGCSKRDLGSKWPLRLSAASKADFTIRIAPLSVELAAGKTIQTIAYNGTVPGPVLRMKEGKPIRVDVFNDTDVPELVHWHGQEISAEADGAEEEGSPFVAPKGHSRISFTPRPAGSRWYHTHVMAMADLTRGDTLDNTDSSS